MAQGGNARAKFRVTTPGPWWDWTETDPAERAIRFIQTYCRAPKGYGYGQPMVLAQFQKDWIRTILAPSVRQAVLQCPRGQGKSTLLAALAVWATFDVNSTGQPSVPIMATTVGQAQRSVFNVAAAMCTAEPLLDDRCLVYSANANARIVVSYNGGECFPIANEVTGLQGLDPTLAIVDEIGFQPLESWSAMVLASGKRSISLVCGVGTPGLDRERSALWHLRSTYLDGATPPGFSFTEYSAPENCDVRDRKAWHVACPALAGGYQAIDALETAVEMTPESHFRVFHLGQWVDGTDSWLGTDGRKVWEALACRYELRDGAPTWVGVDIGLKRDSTAVVVAQRRPNGVLHTEARIWMPLADNAIDVSDIMAHIRELDRRFDVIEVAFDPRLFELPAVQLADEGIAMTEMPQSLERMVPAFGDLFEAIQRREVSHNGDPQYATQILNAVPRLNERGFTLAKRKSRGKIDCAYALAMAFSRASVKRKVRSPLLVL
ncbi:terminase TerL endonuclease subunit [Mycobacterium kubicae]|uniref:terminase TerL endonuclease subunit n=1 Tax=Mycobacterium kubicae TaxID=120959 RepID=UPI0007FE0C90|nr:terminase TerL endonuclease subunit [Mycobacterium kubicae]OBK42077.1 hypothetical protein A5657_08035 [Mycobacterium kubicae]